MEPKNLKIISVSGFGKVTTNMFIYETEKDILLVDCGIGFPTEEMLGVDLLIPDVSYLMDKKEKIRGMVLTHAHEDHIGALPYILPKFPKIPIYATRWALAITSEKLKEYSIPANLNEIDFNNPNYKINLGGFEIETIEVTHSIPETMHLAIKTPVGTIYHAADFKLDLTPVMGKPTDQARVAEIGRRGVLCLLSDCLRAERPGFTPSEKNLGEVFEREIADCQGKFIVTTMSSNLSRFKQAIEISIAHGRKIVMVGRSVEKNIEIALRLGYLNFPKEFFLTIKEADRVPPSKLTLLVAGSQGQTGSALDRIVNGVHEVKIAPKDKVVFSTDYIPGNELAINELIDDLLRAKAEVSYVNINSDVHVSGHGAASDLRKLMELIHPKYLLPIGGNYRHMIAYQKLAMSIGYTQDKILIPDGDQTIDLDSAGKARIGKEIRTGTIIIDALGVGDIGNVVLRDRQVLSQEGMVVAVILLNRSTGELISDPEIISRGFVYVKDSEALLNEARVRIKGVIKNVKNNKIGIRILREDIQDNLEKFFLNMTGRRPMILSQIIEV